VLEALGVKIDAPLPAVQRCLDETGWTFLFAPGFHASTRHAVGPRRELGARTAFNLLGPLTNPARPATQVVGVPRPDLVGFLARCLGRLGTRRAYVVHGAGLDEVTLAGETRVAEIADGVVREHRIRPADAGLEEAPVAAVRGGDAGENARMAQAVLRGEKGPRRDVVLLNAAAALLVAGQAATLRAGAVRAAEAIDSGHASGLLARVKEALGR
jgi:anthranilate phosphoribosyltransferase